jgi:hypothetical protein
MKVLKGGVDGWNKHKNVASLNSSLVFKEKTFCLQKPLENI